MMENAIYDWNTCMIEDKVDDAVEMALENQLAKAQFTELEKALIGLLEHPMTFGDYIYSYLYQKFFDSPLPEKKSRLYPYVNQLQKCTHYTQISSEIYYKIIQILFTQNGLQGRGSLSKKSVTLNKLKGHFEKYPAQIQRDVVYLFGFGLGMTSEEVADTMAFFLMQRQVNLRDPEEVIYYWCLKNMPAQTDLEKKRRIEKISELLNKYQTHKISIRETKNLLLANDLEQIRNAYTWVLENDFAEIDTEEKLLMYLLKLKFTSVSDISLVIRDIFFENLSSFTGEESDTEKEKMQWEDQLQGEEKIYVYTEAQKALKRLEQMRLNVWENNQYHMLSADTAAKLFRGIYWTESVLKHYYSREKAITRNEFLLAVFLGSTLDSVLNGDKSAVKANYYDIRQDWDEQLVKCRMEATYVKNPFDLFLLLCLLQEEPVKYLLANWQLAENTM